MGIHVEGDVEDRALLKGNRALLIKEPPYRDLFPPVAVMWAFMLRTMWKIGLF